MESDLNDIQAMARETRDRTLRYAQALEAAEAWDRTDLWDRATGLAMKAQGAALMTINSAMMLICPDYRTEHGENGYIDREGDEPGRVLYNHTCRTCAPLPEMAGNIDEASEALFIRGTQSPEGHIWSMTEERTAHTLLLGHIYLGVGRAALATDPTERANGHTREWG